MAWLTGEPTLDDVLSDPVVHAMMARDRVDVARLRGFLHDIRRAREAFEPSPACGRGQGEGYLDVA